MEGLISIQICTQEWRLLDISNIPDFSCTNPFQIFQVGPGSYVNQNLRHSKCAEVQKYFFKSDAEPDLLFFSIWRAALSDTKSSWSLSRSSVCTGSQETKTASDGLNRPQLYDRICKQVLYLCGFINGSSLEQSEWIGRPFLTACAFTTKIIKSIWCNPLRMMKWCILNKGSEEEILGLIRHHVWWTILRICMKLGDSSELNKYITPASKFE